MCGVFGILHEKNNQIDNYFPSGLDGSLRRRGPDNQGSVEFLFNSKVLKFGHTRLSILDLGQTGNQPMQSSTGRFYIIYNGEIYNHLKLRKKLEDKAKISWKGTSDTETLLAMFENYDTFKVLNSLEGMFSFVLLDKKKRELTFARDQAGEKPLYISCASNYFSFASDLDPLKKIPGFNNSLDLDSVEDFLKLKYIPSPKTIYENSFKLPPASSVTLKLDKFKLQSFNSFEDFISSPGVTYSKWIDLHEKSNFLSELGTLDQESVISNLETFLTESVSSQLISDVPLGAFLSGGIDSSLIVALMQKTNSKTKTFTVGFDFLEYDESIYAKKIANHLGTDHTEYRCVEKDFFDLIPNLPLAFAEPFADSSQLPTMLVSRMAKKDVKVALSGDAGDELFGGYNRYLLANKYWKYFKYSPFFFRKSLSKALIYLPSSFSHNLLKIFSSIQFSGSIEDTVGKILSKMLHIRDKKSFYTSLTEEWAKDDGIMLFKNNLYNSDLLNHFHKSQNLQLEEAMMKADFQSYLPDDILCKVDRSSMFYSLETRAPYLNKDVINFAFNLPLKFKIRNGETKWILKEILSKYVPKDLYNRPKQGFGIPISKWMRGELKDWVNDMLSDEILNSHNLFNKTVVSQVKDEHFKGKVNHEHKLWSLLQFNQWYISNK